MKIISVLTATRAEYGLLKPIISKLIELNEFDIRVVVTGAHLSPEFGLTYREIENDGFVIDKKIEILLSADTPSAISKSMGIAMIGFADYFSELNPDILIILGDRYETLAVATVAMNQRIPIAHLYGGEATQGAIDESIRHAITKMSYLHFTSTEKYRNRVIQLGETPNRVFNVGSIGVENVRHEQLFNKCELEQSLKFSLNKPYAVVTFHPVTLEDDASKAQLNELLEAIMIHDEYNYIFTKANSDMHGRIINQMLESFASTHMNCKVFTSLGVKLYLSAVKHASLVIGNSSSGIIEAPSFRVPTINIGDRQLGRIQAPSVINCLPETDSIHKAIVMATSPEFRNVVRNTINPYEKENTSSVIVEKVKMLLKMDKVELKKSFFDLQNVFY